jgi:ribonuclease VapC
MMVIDTSAILAVSFDESQANWVIQQLLHHRGQLVMSTVNLAEALMLFRRRIPAGSAEHEIKLLSSDIHFIPPTIEHARLAADARHSFPLNLGDCFAYALSAAQDCPILTLDEDFRRCDRPLVIPPPGT